MTLEDLLSRSCGNGNTILNVTAIEYFKEDKSYYSFRPICYQGDKEVHVIEYMNYLSEEVLALEVKGFSFHHDALWVDVIEWINKSDCKELA